MENNSDALKNKLNKAKKYRKLQRLNSGTFGTVFKAKNQANKVFAIKVIDGVSELNVQQIEQEAKLMKSMRSNHVLQLVDNFYDWEEKSYIIVLPYIRLGNLNSEMNKNWNPDKIMCFLSQIAQGFDDMNQNKVCHNDLKPENILIKSKDEYLICDFGCAKNYDLVSNLLRMSMSNGMGTTKYCAPEIMMNGKSSKYSDVWSLGVILYQILYGKHPITNNPNQYFNMTSEFSNGQFKINYPQLKPEYKSIIQLCKKLLTKENTRIQWKDLIKEIKKILCLESSTTLVTSLKGFVQYINELCILTTGMVELLNTRFCTKNKKVQQIGQLIEYQKIIMQICHFTYIFHKAAIESMERFNKKNFYIFICTNENFNMSSQQKLNLLNAHLASFFIEYRVMHIEGDYSQYKKKFLHLCKQLYNELNSQTELLLKEKKLQWNKMISILKYINSDNQSIDYKNNRKLHNLVKQIIYK